MSTTAQRSNERPVPPFYKSSRLMPYHLQVIQYNGSIIRDRSAGERARVHLVRSSLSLKEKAVTKSDISAPVVPSIDSIHSRPTTATTIDPPRSESRQSLLTRARTLSHPGTAQTSHKLQKTLSRSHSLQLAAAEDPRLKTFAGSDLEISVTSLALRSGESARNSRLLAKETKLSRSESVQKVVIKVKSTTKTTAGRLGKVFRHRRPYRKLAGRRRTICHQPLDKVPGPRTGAAAVRPKSTEFTLQCIQRPQVVSTAQERLYQPAQRTCSTLEVEILGTMLKRAFRFGHTDFSDLRPIGRLLARCTGTLSFKLEEAYPSGCEVLQSMYSHDTGREDDMATLIPPVEAPALIARPDAAPTATGSTSWFVVAIEGPPLKGKPGLRSQIKLGIAGEVIGHDKVAGLAPDFRVCCVSRKQVKNTERSLRQNERQLGAQVAEVELVQSVMKYDEGSIEMLKDLLSMYTER